MMSYRQKISNQITDSIGTPTSLLLHTIFFIIMFTLPFFGVNLQKMLLVLTTVLSIEAIYLALFIQMTVNKTSDDIEEVEKDIDIIQADEKKDDAYIAGLTQSMQKIERKLEKIQEELSQLKQ